MLTVQEYIQRYRGSDKPDFKGPIWLDAMDMMQHILKFKEDTIWPNRKEGTKETTKDELRDGIGTGQDQAEKCQEAFENSYKGKLKVRPEMHDTEGDIDVQAYLNGDRKLFERFVKVEVEQKTAVSIFINFAVNYGDRGGRHVERAYHKVYDIAAQAESEHLPCRVIGVFAACSGDYQGTGRTATPLITFVVLKDFDSPIYPSIWAGIKNNAIANTLCRAVQTEVVGCRDSALGVTPRQSISMGQFCGDDEEVYCFGEYIKP
jgi:hypothetical protein